ncbi:hypothetical protein PDESU_00092 [Pontiella desulfatans]|uniref:SLA1 homology domain-containing protein n=2 Tax=Pontiella desulfatans TaxID=2750659 RepID=A0A6C2TVI3_PONDE|nr:hypothetical protein PDESU_00092 [Pontiella desulfatans]
MHMKRGRRWSLLLGVVFCGSIAQGTSKLHIFTSQQGQVVSARIIQVDSQRGLVELELENKQRKKVKPTVFIESDQAYIRDWAIGQAFMASSGFRFKGEKKVIEDWSESGGIGVNREFEKVVYICDLKNGSAYTFENIEVEYCVYWEQEYPEASGERKERLDYSGRNSINSVAPRTAVAVQTDPVTLVYQYLAGGYYYSNGATGKQSSKMKGVWLKAKLTTESGETFVRDFCEPASVMKQQVWKAPPKAEVETSSGKKKRKKK